MPRRTPSQRSPTLAFGYARDSGGPGQDRSVGDQRVSLTQYADKHGLTLLNVYADEALSGRSDDRPAFQRLIADASAPAAKIGVILVWDYARFGRNETDRAYYLATLAKLGVEVRSLTQQLPEAGGNIMREVLAFADAEYSRQLATNVKRGHHAVLARGYIPGTSAPVGYQVARDHLGQRRDGSPRYGMRWIIDEEVAPRVRQAFALRASGASIRAIIRATALCRTRQGMHHILQNPAYKGIYVYGGESYPGIVPALVDETVWAACQAPEPLHPRAIASAYLLTGLLRCGYCGAAMSGMSNRKTYKNGARWERTYYICSRRNAHGRDAAGGCDAPIIPAAPLDTAVREAVFRDLLEPDTFVQFIAAVRAAATAGMQPHGAAELAQRITRTERAISDLLDLAGQGVMAVAQIAERIKAKESELAELRTQQAQVPVLPAILSADEAALRARAAMLAQALMGEATDIPQQRHVLRQLLARLAYGPHLVIEYKPPELS